jgi:Tol biopolymer transport system component
VDVDGQNQVPLTDNAVADDQPAFSADGERIAFRRSDGTDSEIFVMDVDGQNQVPLTDNSVADLEPAFSPDGERIAFEQYDGTDYEILVVDASGQNQVPLTDNSTDDFSADFSPDGERIGFVRYDGDDEIFAMDADGQGQVRLTDNSVHDEFPAFSPDGQRIAFRHADGTDNEMFAMDASGQNQVPLTDNSVNDSAPYWQPLNSPAFDLSAKPQQRSVRFVSVSAVSRNEDATATVGGTLKAPKIPKAAAVPAKAKRFELAPVTVELQPGQPATLKLPIDKKARKLLKRGFEVGRKGMASVSATATDDLGASSEASQQIKLKKKRKR